MLALALSAQGDDSPGPNIDLDKKMDVDKRCMGLNDYNSDIRKGGRGGGMNAYRPGVSKEVAPGDGNSYYDKVVLRRHSAVVCVSRLFCRLHFVFSHCSLFPPVVFPPLSSRFLLPLHHHSNWSAIGCRCDRPCLWPIRIGALGRRVLALCTHHPLSTSPIPSSTTLSPLDK